MFQLTNEETILDKKYIQQMFTYLEFKISCIETYLNQRNFHIHTKANDDK